MINQILLLLLLILLPTIIHSKKNTCPSSTCGNNIFPIKYPFKLPTDYPPENCNGFIGLNCTDGGHVTITLPFSGEFRVASIDYDLQRIALADPGNCLPGRLMAANLSVYPLDGYFYENYTYYTCPTESLRLPFMQIGCLSNATNGTVATTDPWREYLEDKMGCIAIVTSVVPVFWTSEYNESGNFEELTLRFKEIGCRECEGFAPTNYEGDSKKPFYTSPAFISVMILAAFFMIAFFLRIMRLIPGSTTTTTTTEQSAATTPPQAPGDTPAMAPQIAIGTRGVENSEVKNFSEVVGEGEGTIVSCSICLEEYSEKDRVRKLGQCGHYFHVGCIDEWLCKYSTCPVCRTSLS